MAHVLQFTKIHYLKLTLQLKNQYGVKDIASENPFTITGLTITPFTKARLGPNNIFSIFMWEGFKGIKGREITCEALSHALCVVRVRKEMGN